MKITTKTDYAVILLTSLASAGDRTLSLERVATANGISEAYLQRIAAHLKKAKLIEPKLGAFGGYHLAKPAAEITLFDVVGAVGDSLYTTRCTAPNGTCPRHDTCDQADCWGVFQNKVTTAFASTSIADMTHEKTS